MSTFGNYDAGKSKPVINPYLDGGLRNNGAREIGFNFGFNVSDKRVDYTTIERTTDVTPEERTGKAAAASYNANVAVGTSDLADSAYDREFAAMLEGTGLSPEAMSYYKSGFAVTSSRMEFDMKMGESFYGRNILAS